MGTIVTSPKWGVVNVPVGEELRWIETFSREPIDKYAGLNWIMTSCNSFIIDANLYDWEWRIQAEDNFGILSPWSNPGRFQFGQCRLDDGSSCYVPP